MSGRRFHAEEIANKPQKAAETVAGEAGEFEVQDRI